MFEHKISSSVKFKLFAADVCLSTMLRVFAVVWLGVVALFRTKQRFTISNTSSSAVYSSWLFDTLFQQYRLGLEQFENRTRSSIVAADRGSKLWDGLVRHLEQEQSGTVLLIPYQTAFDTGVGCSMAALEKVVVESRHRFYTRLSLL
jgi:hypothetical protein